MTKKETTAMVSAIAKGTMNGIYSYNGKSYDVIAMFKGMDKVTDKEITDISRLNGIDASVVKEMWKACKAERKLSKEIEAGKRFTLSFKGNSFQQSAVYLTDINRVIFKNLDKNSIVYADCKSGALVFRSITVLSEKSKKYELGKELSKGNESKVAKVLQSVSKGMGYEGFVAYMLERTNIQRREAKGIERSIPRA